jgi:hypothetical protein
MTACRARDMYEEAATGMPKIRDAQVREIRLALPRHEREGVLARKHCVHKSIVSRSEQRRTVKPVERLPCSVSGVFPGAQRRGDSR